MTEMKTHLIKKMIRGIKMIFNTENSKILQLAVAGQSQMTDGCALWDADNGKMVTGSYTTGTIENPENHLIEIYRLPQGESGQIDCKCHENGDCPFWIESEDDRCGGHFDEEMVDEYGDNRINCCIQGCLEDFDFEEEVRESVEQQVRDLISQVISDDLQKLDKIRLEKYRIFNSVVQYEQELMNNNYEMNVLDELVDMAIDSEFILVSAKEFLSGDVDHIASYFDAIVNDDFNSTSNEKALASKVANALYNYNLDEALELLE